MADYPPDRFDVAPAAHGRVGAHRAPAPRSRPWVILAWAALATGVLVALGLLALQAIDRGLDLGAPLLIAPPGEVVDQPETAVVTDPATVQLRDDFTITVLDAAGVEGVGASNAALLSDAGWPVGTITRADESGVETTVVYFSNPADEAIARGMAQLLGVGSAVLSEAFPGAAITIVLGLDAVR
jgi:hypothetical protein